MVSRIVEVRTQNNILSKSLVKEVAGADISVSANRDGVEAPRTQYLSLAIDWYDNQDA
jgi:hypothetical protein